MIPIRTVASLLKQVGTKSLRVCWCDNANIIRAKAVYGSNLEAVSKYGVPLVLAAQVQISVCICS